MVSRTCLCVQDAGGIFANGDHFSLVVFSCIRFVGEINHAGIVTPCVLQLRVSCLLLEDTLLSVY